MRVVMMGTGTFAEPAFEALLRRPGLVSALVTQPDRSVGEKRGSTRQTGRGMKQIALDAGVPVIQPASINAPDGVAMLRELKPDLLVVAAYGQILSPEVLAAPPLGAINVHASLLPKYRGAAPVAWAIWKGETKTGVTIIRMTAGLDAGEMLAQEAIEILPDETAGELEARLAPLGANLAWKIVEALERGPVAGTKQDPTQVTKAPKLKKEMGLIDWSKPAEEVCRQIRAMQPWPTAYTFLHRAGQPPLRTIVNQSAAFPVRYDPAVAAGMAFADPHLPNSLFVTAGLVSPAERSVIEIRQLQPAGKNSMTAAEFLRGHPLHPGDHLGPETP